MKREEAQLEQIRILKKKLKIQSDKLKQYTNMYFDLLQEQEAEKSKSCDGCIYKPHKEGIDSFPMECGECKRFYADMREVK